MGEGGGGGGGGGGNGGETKAEVVGGKSTLSRCHFDHPKLSHGLIWNRSVASRANA